MMSHRSRTLVAGTLLMMPTVAAAQARSSTVFAPPSTGTIAIRTAIVLPDYTIKPLPLLTVSARSIDRTQRPSEPAASPEAASSIAGPVARHTMPNAIPAPAPESRANTSGFFLGLALNGSSIRADKVSSSTESGGGLSVQLGWGFTKRFALLVDGSAARMSSDAGDYDLAHFDIGARWHFVSPSRALVPFLEVGLTGRAASEQNVFLIDDFGNSYQGDLSIQGSGFSFGGGLHYFVAPTWALGGTLKWTTGTFTRVQFNNVSVDGLDLDATSARFNLGFTWYPMGGKAR